MYYYKLGTNESPPFLLEKKKSLVAQIKAHLCFYKNNLVYVNSGTIIGKLCHVLRCHR